MLSLGIIEPSKSEWCNPIVMLPKKDSTIRFCIDFRYLNAISKSDLYPNDLIECLGKAEYHYQLPLICVKTIGRSLSLQKPLGTLSVHSYVFWATWSSCHFPEACG